MLNGKKILALIPARAGSKGLPGKNKRMFCGKPLIAWTIDAAKSSKYIDGIIVSTDDADIAAIAEDHGVPVPFMRPAELATDTATAMEVISHVRRWLTAHGVDYDIVVYLQPTSPLRTAADIESGLELFADKGSDGIVSVCKSAKPGYLINTLPPDGNMAGFLSVEDANKNRQEYDEFYEINGALYIARLDHICSSRNWYGDRTFAYIMPAERSIDIDTESDFRVAEFFFNNGLGDNQQREGAD